MNVIKSEKRICPCCMEKHDVNTVVIDDHTTFKNVDVDYTAQYYYCDKADELYTDENQISANDISMKDAYRSKTGLLTSSQIVDIREKYDITQSDLCILLGWGEKTITRYESHQVQDKAHDTILRKIDSDPEWFISLLKTSKDSISLFSYEKYLNIAAELFEDNEDRYLRKTIEAVYARYSDKPLLHGNSALSLDKVVDVIRYYASSVKVKYLYKVKLMKLLWYADALSYKKYHNTITGLVYQAYPMGAVPVGYNLIINLKNVPCEEVEIDYSNAYRFYLKEKADCYSLSQRDKDVLDIVIDSLGNMTKNQIVSYMHKETAYINTRDREEIPFSFAEELSLS